MLQLVSLNSMLLISFKNCLAKNTKAQSTSKYFILVKAEIHQVTF